MKASDILDAARAEIGTSESPANSNRVKYNTDYYGREVGGPAYPWCAVFVWWCFRQAGASELFYGGARSASCPTLKRFYQDEGQFVTEDFKPGDILFMNFKGGSNATHVGIVEEVSSGGEIITIEGNTSVTSDDNGGAVMRRSRRLNQIIGAGRPNYEMEDEDDMVRYKYLEDIPDAFGFRDIIKTLMDAEIINGDGSDPDGNGDLIDLSHDQVRSLVFEYRGGAFDRKLIAKGITPVVNI